MEESPYIIDIKDMVKRFGDFTANDRLTFQVRKGEIFVTVAGLDFTALS